MFFRKIRSWLIKSSNAEAVIIKYITHQPEVFYAIGDVHGCLDLYKIMEQIIIEESKKYRSKPIVYVLGDFIDRGEHSSQVVDYFLQNKSDKIYLVPLMGNHEDMFLKFLNNPKRNSPWLSNGGMQTLNSYGIKQDRIALPSGRRLRQLLQSNIPQDHINFLKNLPHAVHYPSIMLSHAGASPNRGPHQQLKNDLLWGDARELDDNPLPIFVVHGHMPTKDARPTITSARANIDTGAYATGVLAAVEISINQEKLFLIARKDVTDNLW